MTATSTATATLTTRLAGGWRRWWLAPVPLGRVAVLRTLLYLFIPVDVLLTTNWVAAHRFLPAELAQPLFVERVFGLPVLAHGQIVALQWVLVATAAVAAVVTATGRLSRLLGAAVAVLYLEWMFVAMHYGKVDHDRLAFLVALAVLPTVGRARWRDRTPSEAAGWALGAVQVAVVATYFLAAWAKLKDGGIEWGNSAVLVLALLRRGTDLADPLIEQTGLLRVAQWGIVAFEWLSPALLFLRSTRWVLPAVAFLASFHVVSFLTIRIIFLPHLLCLLAFLPLERLVPARPAGTAPAPVEGDRVGLGS